MRYLPLLIILICNLAFANHVVMLDKATEEILMSNKNPLGDAIAIMKKDALNSEIDLNDVEIKIISDEEFEEIWEEKVAKPKREKDKIKKQKIKNLKNKLKTDLNLTQEEIDLLFQEWND